jgi:hypothetical protein
MLWLGIQGLGIVPIVFWLFCGFWRNSKKVANNTVKSTKVHSYQKEA